MYGNILCGRPLNGPGYYWKEFLFRRRYSRFRRLKYHFLVISFIAVFGPRLFADTTTENPEFRDADANANYPGAAEEEKALREEQLREARALSEAYPDDDNALYLLGLVYLQLGDSDNAIDVFERCMVIDPRRADLLESLGDAVLLRDQYDQAVDYLKKSLEIDPDRFSVRYRLADTLVRIGRAGEAIEILAAGFKEEPEAYRLLGMAHQQKGDLEEARDAFLQAVKLDPTLSESFYGLSMVCARLGETDEAAHYREKFRELKTAGQVQGRDWRRKLNPLELTRKSVAMTHADVGRVYWSQRRIDAAERLWLRAVDLDPDNREARLHLAMIYRHPTRVQDAIQQWKELCRIEPNNGQNYFFLGELLARTQGYEEAETAFRKVVELSPERSEGYAGLCNLYLIQGKPGRELLPLAEKAVAIEVNPGNLVLLSYALEKNGDSSGAQEAIKKALLMDPGNPQLQRRMQELKR